MDVCKEIRGIVYTDERITGTVRSNGTVRGKVASDGMISGIVNYRQCHEVPVYSGNYVVVPKTHEQFLATQNKLMAEDVDVKAIPYFETSNVSGTTVYIANEV